jgi:predicted GNAT family N-acyltransferase
MSGGDNEQRANPFDGNPGAAMIAPPGAAGGTTGNWPIVGQGVMSNDNMRQENATVRLADWQKDEAAIRRVREAVFVVEQAVPPELEWDGEDPQCVHAVAESPECDVIGTGRLLPHGKIGRMAVLADWRGQGIGTQILRLLVEEAKTRGLEELYLHAQTSALDFYARHGFVAEGDEFDEAGIAHRRMRCRLSGESMIEADPVSGTEAAGTRTVLAGKADFANAVARVSGKANRSIAIFTPDLEPGVYDTPGFLETVKRLVLSRSHARIRVLISDPTRVTKSVNRFLFVGRRLSTFIEFRQLAEQFQDREDAFLLADQGALVYRANADRWEGIADTDERRMTRMYLDQFDLMWQSSEGAQELREVKL